MTQVGEWRTIPLAPTNPAKLDPVGVGEILGGERQYEVVQVVHAAPTWNVYHAHALDLTACDNCGGTVVPGTFCTVCGQRADTRRPLAAMVIEQAQWPDAFVAEQRIWAAQQHTPQTVLPSIYDVFESNNRMYLVTPAARATQPPATPWPTVVRYGQMLAGALAWLHVLGVAFGELTPTLLQGDEQQVQVTRWSRPVVFTHDLQAAAVAGDLRALASTLAQIGQGAPPQSLQALLTQAYQGGFASAQAFATALGAIEPLVRQAEQRIIHSGALCDQGRARTSNEDSIGVIEGVRQHEAQRQQWGLYIVSDGMGGHEGGEVASALSVKTFLEAMLTQVILADHVGEPAADWATQCEAAVSAANRAVFEARTRAKSDMGATLVAAALDGVQLTLAHLGDSRAYCWDGSRIRQLTEDHSLIARLIAVGEVTPQEARTHPQRSVLIQSVGEKLAARPSVNRHTLQPGERILLCSDGLHGLIDDAAIARILGQTLSPLATCRALIDAANAAGGDDNISALVIDCVGLDAV